uniref:Btb/poz domain-containing protein 19-like n=1 Tax=Rhizophagus irregularis (strain DAOM 181602 / DAOM 197198 / MUCL 43194) TaxID=747089 RepID=U9UYD8_RHIID
MAFEYSQEIANELEKLLEAEEEYNVIIYAGENENMKEIHAHSILLRIRSQYFRTAFSKEWSEKKDGKYVFNFPNISPQFFKIILRFIYCGKIDLSKLQGPDILKLLIAVDELKIQTLILCIQEYLIKHQHEFLQQNPLEILETVYQRESFSNLWNYYLEEICAKPDTLFKSDKFTNLKAPLLELLLKRDDLSLDEIDIWDSLIKWNSEDFFLKVYPFKILIPEDILDNVLAFHMAPSKKSSLNIQPPRKSKNVYGSVIIGPQHFAIFSSWIEKKDASYYNERNIPYNFNLLYRAIRDGNTPAAFHAKCDNKGATIVILKIPNSEQILGGYNPLQWDSSDTWKSTGDSFLFSFTNKNDFNTAKVGYILEGRDKVAIYCVQNYGPTFGNGHDLFRDSDGNWKNYPGFYAYSKVDIPQIYNSGIYNIFGVEDYEVFQVIKK